MADLSKLLLPDNSEYNIKDAAARTSINNLGDTYVTKASVTSEVEEGNNNPVTSAAVYEALQAIPVGTEWTSGIYQDEDGFINVSPLAGAGGVSIEDGYLVFSPVQSYKEELGKRYLWQDSDGYIRISATDPSGLSNYVAGTVVYTSEIPSYVGTALVGSAILSQ